MAGAVHDKASERRRNDSGKITDKILQTCPLSGSQRAGKRLRDGPKVGCAKARGSARRKKENSARRESNEKTTTAMQKSDAAARPSAVKVLRTRVMLPPREIQKSEIQPQIRAEVASVR